MNREAIKLAIKKAKKSPCHQRVSAVGWDEHGTIIMTATNLPRFSREGGGIHAEMRIMRKRPWVKTILVCRVDGQGRPRPMHPCRVCANKAADLGIRIVTLEKT